MRLVFKGAIPDMLHDAVLAAAPILVVAALVFGPASAWLAARQQRNPAIWLGFGAALGPLAVGILILAPPARCPRCGESTRGFETLCSACGADLDAQAAAASNSPPPEIVPGVGQALAEPDRWSGAPVLRSVPDPSEDVDGRSRPTERQLAGGPSGAQPARLTAVGARRPSAGSADVPGREGIRLDVTLLAMGVLVLGPDPLQAGSRYVVGRTRDRLVVVGPIEASHEHVEFSLPLVGIEANFLADRLVISGVADDRTQRSLVIAFQSVASLTGRAVDEMIMEPAAAMPFAAGHP